MSEAEEDYSFDDFHEDSGEEQETKPLKPIVKQATSPPKHGKGSPGKLHSPLRGNQRGFNDDDASTVDDNASDGVLSLGPSMKFNDSLKYPDLSRVHARAAHDNESDFDYDEIDEEIDAFGSVRVHENVEPIRAISPLLDIPEQLVLPPMDQPAPSEPPTKSHIEVELIEDKAFAIMSPVAQKEKHILHDVQDSVSVEVVEEVPESAEEPHTVQPAVAETVSISISNDSGKGTFDASKLQNVKMKAANMRKRNGSEDAVEVTTTTDTELAPPPVDPVITEEMTHPVAGKWVPHKKDVTSTASVNNKPSLIKSIVSPLAMRKQLPGYAAVVKNNSTATAAPGRSVHSIKNSIQKELTQLGLDALSPVAKQSINAMDSPNSVSNNNNGVNKPYSRRVASTGTTTAVTKQPIRAAATGTGTTAATVNNSTSNTSNTTTNTTSTAPAATAKPYNQKYEQIKKLRTEHAHQKTAEPEPANSPSKSIIATSDGSGAVVSAHPTFSNPGTVPHVPHPSHTPAASTQHSTVTNKYRPSPAEVQSNRRISLKPAIPARKARPPVVTAAESVTLEASSIHPTPVAVEVTNKATMSYVKDSKVVAPATADASGVAPPVVVVKKAAIPTVSTNSTQHTLPAHQAVIPSVVTVAKSAVPTAPSTSGANHMQHRRLRTPDIPSSDSNTTITDNAVPEHSHAAVNGTAVAKPVIAKLPIASIPHTHATSTGAPTVTKVSTSSSNYTHVPSTHHTNTNTSSSNSSSYSNSKRTLQQQQYQPKPPPNKPSVPRQVHHHHPVPAKEQYLPASVLEENSTFSTLLDNSTYSEDNDAEYVLPVHAHDVHNKESKSYHTTSHVANYGNKATSCMNDSDSISNSGRSPVKATAKPNINLSPHKTHGGSNTHHHPHTHVQFKVTEDKYSDHDEEGIPMSAPTAGSGLRQSDYRFPDTSRSATEHNSKHAMYHNNPYTNNVPYNRNKRTNNVYGSKNNNKAKKSTFHPSAPAKQLNVNKARPKVPKFKQKNDWMADPSHRYDESTGLFSSYETDVKREARIEQARINAILRKQAQEREAEIARTAYLKRRHEAEMLQQLKEERQLQLQHQKEQRNLEMQQLYGSPPNPHQHSPLPAVHPSYHGPPSSHPSSYPASSHPVSYVQHSPDFSQESYSVHSSGQSASGGHNGYYSGERSVGSYNRGGNKGNNAYANGNLVNEHHSPYNTPSPVRTKSGPRSHESPHHSPVHHIPTKQVQIALEVEEDDAYSSDPDQNSPDRSAASSPIKGRVSTPKHSPQKVKTEVSHPQGWNNSVNTHSQSKAGYVRKGRNVVEQHADHKNVISTYSKPTAPVSGTNKSSHHNARINATKSVTNAPAHVTTTATIHNVNLNKLFDVSTSSTVVEEHNLNGDSTMSPLYRNNSSTYFSSNNSSVVFNAPEHATEDTAIYDTSYHFNSNSAEKKANLMDPESTLSSHNNSYDRIALLSAAASRVKVDLFGDEVDVNIIQNDIHHGLSIADTPPRRKSSVRTNNNPVEAPEDYYIEKVQSMLGIDVEDMNNIKIHSFYGDNSPRSNTTVASNLSEKQNKLNNSATLAAKGLSLEDAFTYAGELDLPDEGQEQAVTEEIPEQVVKDDGGYDSYGDDDFEDTVEDEVTAGKGYSSPLQKKQQKQTHSSEEIEDEVIIDDFAVDNAVKTLPTVSSLTNSNTSSYAYHTTPNATAASAAVAAVVVEDDYEENDYADEAFETVESSRSATRQRSAKPTATLTSATSSASPSKAAHTPLTVISAPTEPAKPAVLSYESEYEEEFEQEDEPSALNNNIEEFAAPPVLDLSELHPYAFADTVNGEFESINSTLHSDFNGSLNGSPLLGLRLAPSTDTLRGTSTDLYNNTFGSTDVLDNSLQYSVGSNMHTYSRDKFMPGPSDTGFYISQQNSVYDDYADTTLFNNNTTNGNVSAEHNNDDTYADDFDTEYEDREGDNNGIMFANVESATARDVSVGPVDDEVVSNTIVPVANSIQNVGSDDSGDGLTSFLAIDTKVNDISNPDSGAYSPSKQPQPQSHQHKHKHNTSLAIETTEEPVESDTHSPHKHHKHHKDHKDKHRDPEYDSANNSGNNSGSDSSGPNSPSKHKKYHKHQVDTSESAADGVGIVDETASPSRHKRSPNNSRTNSPSKSKHHKHRDKAEHSDEAIADTVSSVVAKFSTARETIGNHTPTHTKEVYSDDEYSFTPPSHAKRINNNLEQKASVDSKPAAVEPVVSKYEAPTIYSNSYQPTTITTNDVKKAKDSSFINTYDDDGVYGDYYFDDTAISFAKKSATGAEPSSSDSIGGGYTESTEPVTTPAPGTVNPTPYSVRNFSIAITDSATVHNLSNSLTNNKPTTTAAIVAAGGSSKKVDLLARIQLNSMAYMEDDDSEIEDPEPAVSYDNSNSTARGTAVLDRKPTTTVSAASGLPFINTNKTTSSFAPLPVLAVKTNSMTYSSQPAPAMVNDNSTDDLDHDVLDLLFDTPTVPTLPVDNAYNSKNIATAADSDIEADEPNDNGGGDYFEDEDHLEGDHSLEEESTLSKHSKHSKQKKHKKSKGKHKHKHKHRVTIIGAASEVDDLNHSSSDSGEDGNFEDTDLDFGLENDYSPSTQLPSVSPVRGNNNTAGDLCEELAFSPSKKHNLPTPSVEIVKEKKYKHKKHKSKRKHKKHKKSKNRTGETDTLESSLGTLDDLDEEGSGENDSSGDEEDEENLGEEEFDF